MNTAYKWLLLILLFAAPAFAQNVRVDNVTFSSVQGFPFLPGATITICTAAGSGLPCAPTVAGTCLSISDTTCNQSATQTSDALGNYGFWIQPGSYTYTVTKAGFGGFGPKALTLSCQPASTCTITGPTKFTTPAPGITTCRFENTRYVDTANSCGWAGTDIGAQANSAAADLGGSGVVLFASGTYSIPSTANGHIVVPADNVSYVCAQYRTCFLNGSSWVAGDFFFLIAAAHKATYIGGFVMQCAPSAPSVDMRGITTNTGVGITSSFGTFENNEIFNCFDGIDIYNGSSDNIFRFNYIHNVNQQGFTINGNRNQILFNRIDTVGTTQLHHGMYVQDGTGDTITGNEVTNVQGFCILSFSSAANTSITDTRIIGNHCNQGGQAAGSVTAGGIGVAETTPTTGNRQAVVSGNTIENTNHNPIYISAVTDTVVSNNVVRTYQGDCIVIQSSAGFTVTSVKITGNVCKTQSVSGNGIRTNPNSGSIANVDIENNQLDTVFGIGIWVLGCTDCSVVNNRIKDWNIQGSNSNSGITIDTGTLRTVVAHNRLSTVNSTGSPAGIIFNSTAADNEISNNVILNIGAGPATFDSSSTRTRQFCNIINITDTNCIFGSPGGGLVLSGATSGAVTHVAGGAVTSYTETDPLAAPSVTGSLKTYTTAGVASFSSSIVPPVNVLISATAPTISAAGCGGAAAAITAPNGTGSFEVSVGTTPGSACTITMPAATTSWTCDANTVSATTTTNFYVKQTGALSTTSVVLTLFSDVAAATAFQGSDTLRVKCSAN